MLARPSSSGLAVKRRIENGPHVKRPWLIARGICYDGPGARLDAPSAISWRERAARARYFCAPSRALTGADRGQLRSAQRIAVRGQLLYEIDKEYSEFTRLVVEHRRQPHISYTPVWVINIGRRRLVYPSYLFSHRCNSIESCKEIEHGANLPILQYSGHDCLLFSIFCRALYQPQHVFGLFLQLAHQCKIVVNFLY